MQNELIEQAPGEMDRSVRRDDLTLMAIAAGVAVVHMATNGRYGFHRDELQTGARRFLRSKWFWTGVALAFLISLPNLIWQLRHDLISLHFLQ